MRAKLLSKGERVSLDIITTLPQAIVETILCLLPIEEAARTSILSRAWRYKWTTIPKLVFLHSSVKRPSEYRSQASYLEQQRRNKEMKCKLFSAIHQVLLLHQGPIHEFTLWAPSTDTCFEMDQIILHLSRNHTLKKLTLYLNCYTLPMSLFSLHQLTDLSLEGCAINHEPVFNGFGSLTSLYLDMVWMSTETLLYLLSNCPSLKSFSHLANDDLLWGNTPTVMEFFKCLPVIEHLTISRYLSEYALDILVPEELTTSLVHLKYFCFKLMRVAESNGWTFLSVLLRCSPNLEKIKLEMDTEFEDCDAESVTFKEYSDVWLEHLIELEVDDFSNREPELEFVKFIMARSPNLKKVILLTWMDDKDEELELLEILSNAPRASLVKVIVENCCIAHDESDDC